MLPNNTLAPLPPPLDEDNSRLLRKLGDAKQALAELKGIAHALPNPLLLVQTLVLQEARQSAEIENILTTHDELYRALALKEDQPISPETKEVLRYREALMTGVAALESRPLGTRLIQELQTIVVDNAAGIRRTPGTIIKNAMTGEVIYTPPEGEDRIRELLANLEWYLHAEGETDPLIRMAVGHYQFEAIHPFYDGNGRTGRLVNMLYLIEQGLLTQPVLYLSAYFLKTRRSYYEGLRAVTERGAWYEWVVYVLEGVRVTARASVERIQALRALMSELEAALRVAMGAQYRAELNLLIFQSPVLSFQRAAEALGVDYNTARKYLKRLNEAGLLTESRSSYTKLYTNVRLLDLLKQPLLPGGARG